MKAVKIAAIAAVAGGVVLGVAGPANATSGTMYGDPAAAARMTAETLPGWFARRCVVDQTGPVLQAGFPARITALCPNSAGRRRSELGLTVVLAKKVR